MDWLIIHLIMGVCIQATFVKITGFAWLLFSCFQECNLSVCGSQIVGLVPLKAILDAAEFYIKRDNLFIEEEDQRVRLVSFHNRKFFSFSGKNLPKYLVSASDMYQVFV